MYALWATFIPFVLFLSITIEKQQLCKVQFNLPQYVYSVSHVTGIIFTEPLGVISGQILQVPTMLQKSGT